MAAGSGRCSGRPFAAGGGIVHAAPGASIPPWVTKNTDPEGSNPRAGGERDHFAYKGWTVTFLNSTFIFTPGWTCRPSGPDSLAVSETYSMTCLPLSVTV